MPPWSGASASAAGKCRICHRMKPAGKRTSADLEAHRPFRIFELSRKDVDGTDRCAAIGTALGFDARRAEGLRVAGYLHDIGKITIPAEILSKPGKLSSIEYQLIQGHPQSSYNVLKDVEFPWPVAEVALQHHERIDGSGYPQGLKGEAILLEARILAVADVMEAMSSHRPYRPGLGVDKALAEIERGRGSVYDAVVVDACVKLFREHGDALLA